MKTEYLNGRWCASVEKFTELILDKSMPSVVVEPDSCEGRRQDRATLYASSRDFPEQSLLPASTPILASHLPSVSSPITAQPSSTFFGTFNKQTTVSHASLNRNRFNKLTPGVRQKMRNGGGYPTGNSARPATSGNVPPKQEAVYRPESLASSVPTQKTYEKLAEVYSSSDDTAQFAGNLRTFVSERIPYGVCIGFAVIEIMLGLIFLFVGALNLPMCEVQPMIPVYLMASGATLIVHGLVRVFASIPSPSTTRQDRNARSKLHRNLCLYAIESIVLLVMLIVVILGCVWVYGARYVHFHPGIFEEDYCDGFIYWTAWWSVTIHLTILSLLILTLIFFLVYGSIVSS